MKLLTKELREKLLANGKPPLSGIDHYPVVKFFTPDGGCTWLLTELDPDGDTLFGLCDLGMGYPELGTVSLSELTATRGKLGLPIERDLWFTANKPLSEYAREAALKGGVNA